MVDFEKFMQSEEHLVRQLERLYSPALMEAIAAQESAAQAASISPQILENLSFFDFSRSNNLVTLNESLIANFEEQTLRLNELANFSQMASTMSQAFLSFIPENIMEYCSALASESLCSRNLSAITSDSLSAMLASTRSALEEAEASKPFSEDDFVTLEKPSSKEWAIPDAIAIPIGKNRVKIKTDLFVGILIEIIFQLLTVVITVYFGQQSLVSDQAYQKEQIRLEQESVQNEHDLLDSIDTSMSSMAETIEDLKDELRVLNSCLQDISSALSSQGAPPESDPSLTDSMSESSNTLSEKESTLPEE